MGSPTCQRNEKVPEWACRAPATFAVRFGPELPEMASCQVHAMEAAGMGLEVVPLG